MPFHGQETTEFYSLFFSIFQSDLIFQPFSESCPIQLEHYNDLKYVTDIMDTNMSFYRNSTQYIQ